MSLFDICNLVLSSIEENKTKLIALLDEHIDFDRLISCELISAFYGPLWQFSFHILQKYFLRQFPHFFSSENYDYYRSRTRKNGNGYHYCQDSISITGFDDAE